MGDFRSECALYVISAHILFVTSSRCFTFIVYQHSIFLIAILRYMREVFFYASYDSFKRLAERCHFRAGRSVVALVNYFSKKPYFRPTPYFICQSIDKAFSLSIGKVYVCVRAVKNVFDILVGGLITLFNGFCNKDFSFPMHSFSPFCMGHLLKALYFILLGIFAHNPCCMYFLLCEEMRNFKLIDFSIKSRPLLNGYPHSCQNV